MNSTLYSQIRLNHQKCMAVAGRGTVGSRVRRNAWESTGIQRNAFRINNSEGIIVYGSHPWRAGEKGGFTVGLVNFMLQRPCFHAL